MFATRAVPVALLAILTTGCGLTEKPTVNTAELLVETQTVVSELRLELTSFQDQIDSLRFELGRQDSLLRAIANLQGMQIPPRAPAALYPDAPPPADR